jgi:hypothetical protein
VTFEKDELRIEQERAGVARPAPRTLASSHLLQALDALDEACSPAALYRPRRTWPLRREDSAATWRTLAGITQRNLCCIATLFTAFAAEAYVNDFLDIHLRAQISAKKFAHIDRHWSTRRKYLEAVALAYAPLFRDSEDDEVIPHLTSLFKVRNALVHARPGSGPPMAAMPDPSWRDEYPPTMVARWLVAVAGAVDLLEVRCYGFDYFSFPGRTIWQGRKVVMDRAQRADALPGPEDPELPPLVDTLNDDIRRANEAHGELRLTVHELRDARLRLAEDRGAWDAFTDLVLRQHGRSQKPPNDK